MRLISRRKCAALLQRATLVLLFVCSFFIYASASPISDKTDGNDGTVIGTVSDTSGAVVADARVSLINAQGAIFGATKSDAQGRFSFANVPGGNYEVRVSSRSFADARVSANVRAGETADVNISLTILPVSEQVTVTADIGQAQTTDSLDQRVNVIPRDRIDQRATAVLAQVADEEVGASLQRTSPTIGAIFVRGLTGNKVSVYTDGVRFTNSALRGGINTFFNLNEPSNLQAVEILRGANGAQYGSDGIGGSVQLVTRTPQFGFDQPELHGEASTYFTSADLSFGGNTLVTYGTKRFGILANVAARRVNNLRPANGIDSHSAINRFLGLPSDVLDSRLTDTAFTQYGGSLKFNYAIRDDQQLIVNYQRSQQDGGKRYDQTLGGDGNLIANLRNLMLDFFYARYLKQNVGFFNTGSFTVSYNTQREERVNQGGQGNPLGTITHQPERTKTAGFNFYLDKQFGTSNSFVVGGDIYRDRVVSPAYTFNPANGATTLSRPRVPDGARYILAGAFAQTTIEVIPSRLRVSGALRYNVASYRSRAANSPLVGGRPLFPDDSLRVDDFSGRVGAVLTITDGLNAFFRYSRGFHAPSTTDLGTLGLVGNGFEVDALTAAGLGATIGTSAGADAVSTGVPATRLRSETSDNFDAGFNFRRGRFDTEFTAFTIGINNSISSQALILPPGAVGRFLGDQQITRQDPNGVVFVPLSTAPVLVRTNFDDARIFGIEYEVDYRFSREWEAGGNFTYLYARNVRTGAPPNIEGGTPAPRGFVRLRYQPNGKRYFVEGYSTLVDRQERLSSLDLSDRRTGAARSRSQIASFFNNGARVRGLVQLDSTGTLRLVATGETLLQVQNRLLPLGATINGVTVANNNTAVPLFAQIPGYGLFNVRGGFFVGENSEINIDFENITDQTHRGLSWGIDGPGRSITARYRLRF